MSTNIEHKDLRYLDLEVELKSVTGEGFPHGGVMGYANTTGNLDRVGDITMPGAYDATVDSLVADGYLCENHEWDDPKGYIIVAKPDKKGLYFEAAYHSTDAAQDLRTRVNERLAAGKTVKVSIGYKADKYSYNDDGNRLLEAITVYEISIVTVPANPAAEVTSSKDDDTSGTPFLNEATAALGAVTSLIKRAKAIEALRQEKGGHLGAVAMKTLSDIQEACKEIDDLKSITVEETTETEEPTQEETVDTVETETLETMDAADILASWNALEASLAWSDLTPSSS